MMRRSAYETVAICSGLAACPSNIRPAARLSAVEFSDCEKVMQEHQVRRVPVVDGQNHVIGIVSQADLALKGKPEHVSKTVAEISKPSRASAAA
jgi:CBS-domain-containing membrane protein